MPTVPHTAAETNPTEAANGEHLATDRFNDNYHLAINN